jgi:hypothetical protein
MSVSFLAPETLPIMVIHPMESDTELFHRVRVVSDAMDELDAAGRKYSAPVLTIDGFNHDPRELWHIPQAVQTIKRACDAGFLSILYPSVLMAGIGFNHPCGRLEAFGALELWLVASGLFAIDGYVLEINQKDMLRFLKKEMPAENERLRKRIAKWRSMGGEA